VEKEKIGVAISHVLKAFIVLLGIWSLTKQDYVWAFASFFSFFLALSPLIMDRNFKISLPWGMELLILIPLTMHVWGGVLGLYSVPYYDKVAHFISSAIIAFLALITIYVLDVYWEGLKMDLLMVGFFIVIFTIALGGIWEIGEYVSDLIIVGGPKAQVSLEDTMMDLIYDTIAGILVGIGGTMAIRRGEFRDIITSLGKEAEKLRDRPFVQAKRAAVQSLQQAIGQGEVDRRALPLLEALNAREDYFTTSSCAGRIVLLEVSSIGNKTDARFLEKWEEPMDVAAVHTALARAESGQLWLMAQPPIFHVATTDLDAATVLLDVARQSGFKNSSIKALGSKIRVEIASTEEMDVPLGRDGRLLCSGEYLDMVVAVANEILHSMEDKLASLQDGIAIHL